MAKREVFYLIDRDWAENHSVPMLDMLRYDHAMVESNVPGGFYLLRSSSDNVAYWQSGPFQRWLSFGITPLGPFRSAAEAGDYARALEAQQRDAQSLPPIQRSV